MRRQRISVPLITSAFVTTLIGISGIVETARAAQHRETAGGVPWASFLTIATIS